MEPDTREILVVVSIVLFVLQVIYWGTMAGVCRYQSRPNAQPDRWVGIRFRATMQSQRAWITAHKVILHHTYLVGVSIPPVGLVFLFFMMDHPLFIAVLQGILFVVEFVWMAVAVAIGVRAAKVVNGD
jgi:hypothetical protein